MRQGRKLFPFRLALATCALAVLPLVTPAIVDAAGKTPAVAGETKAKSGYRQFTGIVTALDKNTLTVEKRGKKPQTRVFTRHAELQATGDLAKDARVTVFYRDQDGRAVAHRVVVKPEDGANSGDR